MAFRFLIDADVRRIRMWEWIGFAIHAFVYAVVNYFLFNLNDQIGPGDFSVDDAHIKFLWWYLFPLLGWGAGLALHFLFVALLSGPLIRWRDGQVARSVLIYGAGGAPSPRLLLWAKRKAEERLGFIIHFFFYVVINLILIEINFSGIGWVREPGAELPLFPWFWFPLIGWGFGFAIHVIVYVFATALAGYREPAAAGGANVAAVTPSAPIPAAAPGDAPMPATTAGEFGEAGAAESESGEYAEYRRCERIAAAQVRFFRHAIVFLFVNAALFAADLFLSGDLTFAPWVAFVWAFFLLFHCMNTFFIHKDRLEKMKQDRIDRLMGNK